MLDHNPKEIPPCLAVPAGSEGTFPIIRFITPGVGQKNSQGDRERKSLAQEYLQTHYPKESWTHVYTDGSAENTLRNGYSGVYIQYPEDREDKISLATGLCSTNYKDEVEALKTAAVHTEASTHASHNVVLLTNVLSILQALQSNRDTDHNNLCAALASLFRSHAATLQWSPSHCNVPGNEAADCLAKGGTAKEQVNRSTSYSEVKTILNAKQRRKRSSALGVLANQTTEHLLQSCPLYELLRKGIWPDHTPVALKLCDSRGTYDILPPSSRRLVASWTPQVDPPCTPPPNPQGPTTTIPKCT